MLTCSVLRPRCECIHPELAGQCAGDRRLPCSWRASPELLSLRPRVKLAALDHYDAQRATYRDTVEQAVDNARDGRGVAIAAKIYEDGGRRHLHRQDEQLSSMSHRVETDKAARGARDGERGAAQRARGDINCTHGSGARREDARRLAE